MTCAEAQEVLSAAADGEADEVELRRARRHASSCSTCSAYMASIKGLADSPDEPLETTVELAELPGFVRWTLWVVASAQLVVGLPMLVGVDILPGTSPSAAHLARDGALACVMAVILGVIALRPRWALPLGILSIGVFLLQAVGSGTDLARGQVHLAFEWVHIIGAIGVVIALLAATVVRPKVRPREPRV